MPLTALPRSSGSPWQNPVVESLDSRFRDLVNVKRSPRCSKLRALSKPGIEYTTYRPPSSHEDLIPRSTRQLDQHNPTSTLIAGAFRLLVTDRGDAAELVDVRRFRHEWERTASLALRDGRPTAATPYFQHDRVTDGDRDAMVEALYQAWRADTRAGRTSLMLAADAATVAELNARARADLVALGQVTERGVSTSDGSTVGVGDLVVTRFNQRDLNTKSGWVKNGDQWKVTAVNRTGH